MSNWLLTLRSCSSTSQLLAWIALPHKGSAGHFLSSLGTKTRLSLRRFISPARRPSPTVIGLSCLPMVSSLTKDRLLKSDNTSTSAGMARGKTRAIFSCENSLSTIQSKRKTKQRFRSILTSMQESCMSRWTMKWKNTPTKILMPTKMKHLKHPSVCNWKIYCGGVEFLSSENHKQSPRR